MEHELSCHVGSCEANISAQVIDLHSFAAAECGDDSVQNRQVRDR